MWGMPVNAAINNEREYDVCDETISRLAYGKEKFVGITLDGYGMSSEDGYDWNRGMYIGSGIEKLTYCGDYFYAYGSYCECYVSADGIKWNRIKIGDEYSSVEEICYYSGEYYAFVNQMVFGAGGLNLGWVSYIYSSDDGVKWHYEFTDRGATHGISIVGKNVWLTFGKQDLDACENKSFLWNGREWEYIHQIAGEYCNLTDGVYGNGGFVAVDDSGKIYVSGDGQSWKQENNESTAGFCKVIYGKNHYFAYNTNGELFFKNAIDSTNMVWKKMVLNTDIYDITYGEGKIIVSSYDYGIMVNEVGHSANAFLSNVAFKDAKLLDIFEFGKYSYQVRIPQNLSNLSVAPTLLEAGGTVYLGMEGVEKEIPSAKMTCINLKEDEETFYLKVVAENGVTYKKYFFEIQRTEQYFIEAESVTGGTVYGSAYGEIDEKIELSAVPLDGYVFTGWYENGTEYSSRESITITVTDKDRKFTPVFQLLQNEEITIVIDSDVVRTGEYYAVKAINEKGEECECQFKVLNGVYSNISLDYEGESYCLYVDSDEKNDTLIIQATLTTDDTVQTTISIPVHKETATYQIVGECTPKEAGYVIGNGDIEEGQSVLLRAEENAGYIFKNWNMGDQFYSDEKEMIISDVQENYFLEAIYEKLNLHSIKIMKEPEKLIYYEGDVFQPQGMKVVAYYTDGSGRQIENYTFDKNQVLKREDDRIVISYSEGGETKSAVLAITVLPKEQDESQTEEREPTQTPEDGKTDGEVPPTPGDETQNGNGTQTPENPNEDDAHSSGNEEQTKTEIQTPENENQSGESTPKLGEDKPNDDISKNETYKKNQKIQKGKLTYQITQIKKKTGSVSVIRASKNVRTIVIPDQIKMNGYTFQVTKIGRKAFYSQKRLAKVTIGKNIKTIEQYAFAKCIKLKQIEIKSASIKKVGKNAFSQIPKKNRVKIPGKCKKKYAVWMKRNKLNMR